ncbi:hypothetical protein RQP53_24285 [Paucibacter sp. APW11]|uniref:Cytochrome n=1 Tax=Roseateles aquae TaxID=3077235 RepID=A0ABU3PJT2_9BURK|nr:hypothetical protein [Paucibacter sp. APW11]MDT9002422.1 hypothetical protein [Paucibacter sp. APW11]
MLTKHAPLTLLTAAHAADPWPFYAERLQGPGLHHDPSLQLWWAGDAPTVRQLLADPRLGVRPPEAPVPPALRERPLGRLFSQWLRMRDDAAHAPEKQALQAALGAWPAERLRSEAARCCAVAASGGLAHWQWASLPCTVAALLGLTMDSLAAQQQLLGQLAGFARALKADAEPEALSAADAACEALSAALAPQDIALLWQAYEAGAALLGQAWLEARLPEALARLGPLQAPVHHTRRWAHEPLQIGGQVLPAGSPVLLLLLAEPDLAWGHGAHRCPGRDLALAIAAEALRHAPAAPVPVPVPVPVPDTDTDTEAAGARHHWPLPNARIPVL